MGKWTRTSRSCSSGGLEVTRRPGAAERVRSRDGRVVRARPPPGSRGCGTRRRARRRRPRRARVRGARASATNTCRAATRIVARRGIRRAPAEDRAASPRWDGAPPRPRRAAAGYRTAKRARKWVARPIFESGPTHPGLTFRQSLEKWKAVRLRLAAAVAAIVAFFGAPAAQAGSRNAFQQLLARALHARHVSPAQTGAIVLDLRTGSIALRPQLRPLAPPRVEREARNDVRSAERPRPGVPDRDRRARRGAPDRHGLAGRLVLKGYGDPDADRRGAGLARAPGGRGGNQARERPDPRRRELVRRTPYRARLEGAVLPPRVACALGAHRQPRLDGPLRDGPPALMAAQLFRPRLVAQASRSRARRRSASRPDGAVRSATSISAGLGARPLHGHLQRQLLRGDAAEAGRRRAGGAGHGGAPGSR